MAYGSIGVLVCARLSYVLGSPCQQLPQPVPAKARRGSSRRCRRLRKLGLDGLKLLVPAAHRQARGFDRLVLAGDHPILGSELFFSGAGASGGGSAGVGRASPWRSSRNRGSAWPCELEFVAESWELVEGCSEGSEESAQPRPDQVTVLTMFLRVNEIFNAVIEDGARVPLTPMGLTTIMNAEGSHNAKVRGVASPARWAERWAADGPGCHEKSRSLMSQAPRTQGKLNFERPATGPL